MWATVFKIIKSKKCDCLTKTSIIVKLHTTQNNVIKTTFILYNQPTRVSSLVFRHNYSLLRLMVG